MNTFAWWNGGSTSVASPLNQNKSTPQVDENKVVDNQAEVDNQIIESQREAYDYNQDVETQIQSNFDENQQSTQEYAEDRIKRTEEYYNKNEELIRNQNNEIQKIEESQLETYWDRVSRDTVLLNQKKNSDITYLRAQQAKQKSDNEDNIRQARQNVELEKQKSAWAYQKLGLGFSSGIINQSQQIATDWIADIANIKATMTLNEAQMASKISDVEYNYATLVNRNIDNYVDKIDSIKKDMRNRIAETNKSMVLNSFSKKNEIEEIEQWAREQKKMAEQEHITAMQETKAKGIEYLQDIQSSIAQRNQKELAKLDTMLQNGTIASMTPEQIAQKEKELGIPAGTINTQLNQSIAQKLTAQMDAMTWGSIMPLDPSLIDEVKQEMEMRWLGWDDAVNTVVDREARTNPEFREAIANRPMTMEEKKLELDYAKLKADTAYKNASLNLNRDKYELDVAELWEEERQFDAKNSEGWYGLQLAPWLSENGANLLLAKDSTLIPTRLDKVSAGNPWGKECGEFVNDVFAWTWMGIMWDTLDSKLKVASSDEWGIGNAVVWNPWNNSTGHTWIIMGEDKDNWLVKSSNLNYDGRISTDKVPKSSMLGYSEYSVIIDKWMSYGEYLESVPNGDEMTEKKWQALSNEGRKNEINKVREELRNEKVMEVEAELRWFIENPEDNEFKALMDSAKTKGINMWEIIDRINPTITRWGYVVDENGEFVEWDADWGRKIPTKWEVTLEIETWVIGKRKGKTNIFSGINQVDDFWKIPQDVYQILLDKYNR